MKQALKDFSPTPRRRLYCMVLNQLRDSVAVHLFVPHRPVEAVPEATMDMGDPDLGASGSSLRAAVHCQIGEGSFDYSRGGCFMSD